MKQEFFSDVSEDGRLSKRAYTAIQNALLELIGKRVVISISVKRKVRSLNQNRYYWGVVILELKQAIWDEWQQDVGKDECHEILKRECNYEELANRETGEIVLDKNGKSLRIPKPTSGLTTTEFEEYQDRCRKFIFEYFNRQCPLPNEQKEMFN